MIDPLTISPCFVGELMTCALCGRQEKSDPSIRSNWRVIEADGVRHYFCPAEFPPDWASAKKFQAAYTRCLQRILEPRKKNGGAN